MSAQLPDRLYRQLTFLRVHRWPCNLEAPRSFNEKVNWRILYDRRPLLEWTCDKLLMKERARSVGVDCPDVLWSGTDVGELAEVDLEGRWVLKPNHSSGRHVVFGAGRVTDTGALEARFAGALRDVQSRVHREWAYTKARRMLFVERFVEGPDEAKPPPDYKFFVFGGGVGMIQVDLDRYERHVRSVYTPEWEKLPWTYEHPDAGPVERPENLGEMISAARKIAQGFDFLRVDLYTDGTDVLFGEVSPYPVSARGVFSPREADFELGRLWALPMSSAGT